MSSVHFQGKHFSIAVIQVYAPISNAEEAEVEQVYENLQDIIKLKPQKDALFVIVGWVQKPKSRNTWSNRQIWPRSMK